MSVCKFPAFDYTAAWMRVLRPYNAPRDSLSRHVRGFRHKLYRSWEQLHLLLQVHHWWRGLFPNLHDRILDNRLYDDLRGELLI